MRGVLVYVEIDGTGRLADEGLGELAVGRFVFDDIKEALDVDFKEQWGMIRALVR